MNDRLTTDEYDALRQVAQGKKQERVSACVARNTKRLTGLKFMAYGKDKRLALTEKGQLTLFVKRCVDALRAVGSGSATAVDADVAVFLQKKGHIVPAATPGQFEITQRGRESLADIDAEGR
ncbi:hypothetical protein [Noviherbaspirillum suwonense]|uniref:Uncharacterized protein n=1 Tax=Noviherbaspirillum suwonense TaxID=1224511 RepID=A0ABY1QWN5_9BURK|nr:hypothetical protein [Noviherbaspirillum suwonense]SMP80843.1 hypothetical protein SAMN06295970_13911 [Noviherbaspirillum suwonense]